jgi:hypothetical protein
MIDSIYLTYISDVGAGAIQHVKWGKRSHSHSDTCACIARAAWGWGLYYHGKTLALLCLL